MSSYNSALELTKEQLLSAPERQSWHEDVYCDAFVIIPTDYLHDSEFRCMEVVALDDNNQPICKCAGGSDVIHLNGIGGYGHTDSYTERVKSQSGPLVAWSIDCLPCGYLRLFTQKGKIKIGEALSDLGVYAEGYY